MTSRSAVIITADGLGDGLMMMTLSEALLSAGYRQVVTINPLLIQLRDWFNQQHLLCSDRSFKNLEQTIRDADDIILQNDNSERSSFVFRTAKDYGKKLYVLYPTHDKNRHPELSGQDVVFNGQETFIDNILKASRLLFDIKSIKKNPIIIPEFKRCSKEKRVVLHPTASTSKRMWSLNKFVKLAYRIEKYGFNVAIAMSPKELEQYGTLFEKRWLSQINDINDTARLIDSSTHFIGNESGLSHLASALNIPSLVISGDAKRMQLWQPGWRKATIITPPRWIPNFKGMRLRDEYWSYFIPEQLAWSHFKHLLLDDPVLG